MHKDTSNGLPDAHFIKKNMDGFPGSRKASLIAEAMPSRRRDSRKNSLISDYRLRKDSVVSDGFPDTMMLRRRSSMALEPTRSRRDSTRTGSISSIGEEPEEEERIRLKRRFGFFHAVALNCGVIIGSGIYIAPKGVVTDAGSPGLALLLWGMTGIVGTLGCLTFAELGTMFPAFGEKYVYLEEMYGPGMGFIYMFLYNTFVRPAANTIKCLTFAKYIVKPAFGDCLVPDQMVDLVAMCLAVLLTALNCVNVKWAARGQTLFTSVSVISLAAIGATGLYHIGIGNTAKLDVGFEGTTTNPADVVLAFYSCVFASWGWNAINFMVEELEDPYKTLPRALVASILLVTGLYVIVNVAYLAVLGTEGVIASDAVALTFTQQTWGMASLIMPIVIAINTAGSFNSGILVGSRLCYAGARRGHLPEMFAYINIHYLSPITALIFQCVVVIVMIQASDIFTLLKNMVFSNSLFDALAVAGMIWLRITKPDLHRPIKMPLIIPILFLFCVVALVMIPLLIDPSSCAFGLIFILVTGIPYYVIFVLWTKPQGYTDYVTKIYHFMQKFFCCVPEEADPFL